MKTLEEKVDIILNEGTISSTDAMKKLDKFIRGKTIKQIRFGKQYKMTVYCTDGSIIGVDPRPIKSDIEGIEYIDVDELVVEWNVKKLK